GDGTATLPDLHRIVRGRYVDAAGRALQCDPALHRLEHDIATAATHDNVAVHRLDADRRHDVVDAHRLIDTLDHHRHPCGHVDLVLDVLAALRLDHDHRIRAVDVDLDPVLRSRSGADAHLLAVPAAHDRGPIAVLHAQ